MATCSYGPIGYVPPVWKAPSCCTTIRSIVQWMVEASNGTFQYGACYVKRNIFGSSRPSVHGTGRAYDVMIKNWKVGGAANRLMERMIDVYLMSDPCGLGIQRMIFQERIWNAGEPNVPFKEWRFLNNPLRSQQPHENHLHIEIHPAFCQKFTVTDIRLRFSVLPPVSQLVKSGFDPANPYGLPVVPKIDPQTPPPPSGSGSTTGGSTDGSAGGTGTRSVTGTGTGSSGKDPIIPPDQGSTAPVYSPIVPELTACGMCGPPFSSLVLDGDDPTGLTYTHCGGTGSICIERATGRTCSQGTAPVLGNFPGPIKDFLFWGTGAYALSADGNHVYTAGATTPPEWDNVGDPTRQGPWDSLYGVGPATIAVSGIDRSGFKTARGRVPSIARYSCCS